MIADPIHAYHTCGSELLSDVWTLHIDNRIVAASVLGVMHDNAMHGARRADDVLTSNCHHGLARQRRLPRGHRLCVVGRHGGVGVTWNQNQIIADHRIHIGVMHAANQTRGYSIHGVAPALHVNSRRVASERLR